MGHFETDQIDRKTSKISDGFLPSFIDRLAELDDLEPAVEFEPLPQMVEIDGVTPHRHYYYDDDCCEGMRW